MRNSFNQRLDSKLECPTCQKIYLTFKQDVVEPSTSIVCSSCGDYMGTWAELEADFYAQGGGGGVFEMP